MLSTTILLAALQVGVQATPAPDTAAHRDSSSRQVNVGPRAEKRRTPTARDSATAFRDPEARAMILAARAARLRQDSALTAYDATSTGRVSVGMGLGKLGRDRLIFRMESVSRVRWSRSAGVWMDVQGHRTALPIVPKEDEKERRRDLLNDAGDMAAIPYFPGSETLWIGGQQVERAVEGGKDNEGSGVPVIHPLGRYAESYYTFETGDSASFRLPDGRSIRIREVRVRPRESKWNVAVGSLWFDADRGTLVRAAYRMAEPIDLFVTLKEEDAEDAKDLGMVKGLLSPMKAQLQAIAVEYGLHEGRFWLPRLQYMEGSAQVGFMHVPIKVEQAFRYASVNGTDPLPAIHVASDTAKAPGDSTHRHGRSIAAACDTSTTGYIVQSRYRYGETKLPVAVKVPCDVQQLASSPLLPASIYEPGEEVFGAADREELIQQALTLGAQPAWGIKPPTLEWGLRWLRFNRVEGFSVGAQVDQDFGAGYGASLTARLGLSDRDPVVELFGRRTDLTRTLRAGGYHRLVAIGDRGDPLSLGSSLAAALWGRDEGFYYRATGVEVGWQRARSSTLDVRAFVERETSARVHVSRGLASEMTVPWNVNATEGTFSGAVVQWNGSRGVDPLGFRVLSAVRAEGASRVDSGGAGYGRLAADLTFSHGLGSWMGRQSVAALTLAGGSSLGTLPPQRGWYLGGLQTVRGQAPGTAAGDAYWLTRGEVGWDYGLVRPTLFADMGWAGSRRSIGEVGKPLSGAGVGLSFMDGMLRLDVARGINPGRQVRIDLSMESRF